MLIADHAKPIAACGTSAAARNEVEADLGSDAAALRDPPERRG
jgi:hypothetical protein